MDNWYQSLEKQLATCQKCRLYKTATQAVIGEGNHTPELVFVGEAPGFYEDKEGRPFVGRAGQLLNELLTKINLRREDVYITNIVKHRPPENRDPAPDEIAACEGYLSLQLEMLEPKLVVTLGRFSYNYFFPTGRISQDHGELKKNLKHAVFPVYHPAAALRNGNMKEALTEDFLRIPKILAGLTNTVESEIDDSQLRLV
ncbi:hypothetical protein A3A70_02245 [candidate division WWE3 bacterium RIFCSPLOWO2_01_FULL_42_11]|uniref:Type-4 uracil-DNA glycosylase n=1 Tax=candidate division WWE3 bacterium RIFCSPLOWO2_01_FULL_42_11 TaxID=1802627 RepID=A0A1F4VP66_UNCKA|nr:MAG: hypothetical protein A3A70_02245 [candidate division WWE3 bacterium RIFCSPLOWO2_01_FULL_42_11]